MKLTIDRSDLLRALSHVQSVVEKRNTIPILSNVLLSAGPGALTLTATDLDIEAVDAADASVDQEGGLTAPAQTLFDVIRKLPESADVQLEFLPDNQRLSIQSGRSRFALPTLPASDFQTMTKDAGSVNFSLDASDLKRLIDKTRFAISTEETRYYLNGVYLHIHDGDNGKRLRAVATDGHRLALSEIDAPEGSDGLAGVIIPRKAVSEVRRLIDGFDGIVSVSASEAKIVFTAGRAVLTTKLIDGSFPDYVRVIPQNNDKTMKVANVALEKAVDRVATVSAERSRSVKMSLEADKIILTVNHAETGHGVEEIEAEYASDPMEIGFNARYLLDVFQQIDGDVIEFDFSDPSAPALVRDPEDEASRFVLMPLRV
ncbi:MAG: DNA polymerase III subunit beta [Ponticaulis sp.]|nr:DNA polymerase III subunit beta [Ponticaulis sp.]|tara:strand:- start:9232 stop:10350 length:1119 start_codon:yes stop_codon:yes gene_type:complete